MPEEYILDLLDRHVLAASDHQILRAARQSSWGRWLNPYLLRQWWAHTWQAKGENEGSLQLLGGWQDVSSMRRYGAALRVDRALGHYHELNLLEDL